MNNDNNNMNNNNSNNNNNNNNSNNNDSDTKKKKSSTWEDKPDFSHLNPKQKRLAELKWKLKLARKANRREANREHQLLNGEKDANEEDSFNINDNQDDNNNEEKKNINNNSNKKKDGKNNWQQNLIEQGIDPKQAYMAETAELVEYRRRRDKKKEKNRAPFGWDAFNQDATYRAYKKRLDSLPETKDGHKDESTIRNVNSLDYLNAPTDPKAVGRMVKELKQREKRVWSRRRTHWEDADVDYINKNNERFNKKLKRAYDKYTVEIRNNLERGTAL